METFAGWTHESDACEDKISNFLIRFGRAWLIKDRLLDTQ